MIRKYLSVAVVWILTFSVLQGISIPLGTSSPIDAKIREIKKISGSQDKLFVLNQATKTVTIFDQSLQKQDTFYLSTDVPNQAITPQDITYLDGSLFITNQAGRNVLQYSESGKFIKTLPILTEILTKPSAILGYDGYLLISDLGCIWITDRNGKLLNRIHLPENRDGAFCTISDISFFQNELYLADTTNNQILVYQSGENWIDFTYTNTIGGFGIELGRFMRLNSAVGYGKIFGCDGVKNNIQIFHPLTKEVEIVTNEGLGLIQPSDMTIVNQKIYVVDEKTEVVTTLPLITGPEYVPVLSTTSIDFGSTYDPAEKQFLVYNQSGYPMKGTISVSNPAFMVEPMEFMGVKNSFTVSIKGNLQAKLIETGKITINLPGKVTKTIEVKVRRSSDPDFTIEYPKVPEFNAYERQLVFTIETQNRLGEASEIVVQNKNIPFDLIKLDVDKYALLPIRNPLPGIYSITFTAKAPRNKIIKQGNLTFLYKGTEGAVPTTVLGEYCVADWCEYCPSGHRALNELSQKMTRDQISFLTYYTDCQQATDVRLCFDEGDKRVKWYVPGGTHVSLYLSGTTVINGGINGPEATMTSEYQEKINVLLRKDSPISLTGSAILNQDRTITVGASINVCIPTTIKDPRLICAIVENDIPLPVSNGETVHQFVARQFISLPNPEKNAAFGTPIEGKDREDIQLQARIDPIIKLENAYCLIFVQDLATTEVFQTRYIPLQEKKETEEYSIDCRAVRVIDDGNIPPDIDFQLQNWGDHLEEYMIDIPEKSDLPRGTELIVNGNSFSALNTLGVFLNPSDIASIKLHFQSFITEKSLKNITLSVIHEKDNTTQSIILPVIPYENSPEEDPILFPPYRELTSKNGFYSSMDTLTMVLKMKPGTQVSLQDKKSTVPGSGILFFPINISPGKNEMNLNLIHPNYHAEKMVIRIQGYLLIQLTLDDPTPMINGKAQPPLEYPPFLQNGRTMVPLRFISEAFGSKVDYDVTTSTITVYFEDKIIIMHYNNPQATINGKMVIMDAPYTIRQGRSFVPIRFIAETFGAKVEWIPQKREIRIRL
jgi:thiol-disulfide isomerase/thioredoxin